MSADGLSAGARRHLLAMARGAMEDQLSGELRPEDGLGELRLELERRCGAFVTLTRRGDGELRGCVGVPEPLYRLDQAVARAAVAAAVYDRRFHPAAASDLPGLALHFAPRGELGPIAPDAVQL